MSFPFPFNRAAHAGNLFGRPVLGGGDYLHRLEQIATNALGRGLLARFVETAAILQREIAIEAEKVGRAHRTVSRRYLLRLVDHIGEGKTEFVRHLLHVVEGILGVFGGIIRHDGDGVNAVVAPQFGEIAHQPRADGFHIRAVVADEHHQEAVRPHRVRQRPPLAVDAGQTELWGFPAKIAYRGGEGNHDALRRISRQPRHNTKMSAPRFYLDQPLAPGARFSLPPGPARHAARALRLAVDDTVTLFNGQGGEYSARIERIHKDEVAGSVTGVAAIERESRLRVLLAQGISSGERMDYTLQKAVELGVTAIQPIAARRSVVKLAGERTDRRVAHWQGVVASACEQCGRNQVPAVAAPLTLASWLGKQGGGRLLFLSPQAEARLADLPAPTAMDCLVAGPEGGFEADEIAALGAAGAIAVRLGPRVLRTETAALAALAAMQTLWGDF